jgi:hypothetical protein
MSLSGDNRRYAAEFEAADTANYERRRDARWRRGGGAQRDLGDAYYEAYDDAQGETNSFMQRRSLLILAALVVVGGAGLMASAVSWRGAPAPAEIAAREASPAPAVAEAPVAAPEAAPQVAPVIIAPTAPAKSEAENNTGAAEAVAPSMQAPSMQAPSVQAPVAPSPATESMATIEALPAPVAAAPAAPAASVTALDPAPAIAEARADPAPVEAPKKPVVATPTQKASSAASENVDAKTAARCFVKVDGKVIAGHGCPVQHAGKRVVFALAGKPVTVTLNHGRVWSASMGGVSLGKVFKTGSCWGSERAYICESLP